MQAGNANYENDLIVQIYLSAAEDYVAALITNDLVEQITNKKFLESGSQDCGKHLFFFSCGQGKRIACQSKKSGYLDSEKAGCNQVFFQA